MWRRLSAVAVNKEWNECRYVMMSRGRQGGREDTVKKNGSETVGAHWHYQSTVHQNAPSPHHTAAVRAPLWHEFRREKNFKHVMPVDFSRRGAGIDLFCLRGDIETSEIGDMASGSGR